MSALRDECVFLDSNNCFCSLFGKTFMWIPTIVLFSSSIKYMNHFVCTYSHNKHTRQDKQGVNIFTQLLTWNNDSY